LLRLYTQVGGLCGVCAESVDPAEVVVDHVVPLTRGGTDDLANMQITHRRCNQRKGRRLPEETALCPDHKVAAWRLAHGLTQARLATLLGVKSLTVSQWETGRRKGPPGIVLDLALERLDQKLVTEVGPSPPAYAPEMPNPAAPSGTERHSEAHGAAQTNLLRHPAAPSGGAQR
jgi:transcriptional regulator with XRE-family HTH domain